MPPARERIRSSLTKARHVVVLTEREVFSEGGISLISDICSLISVFCSLSSELYPLPGGSLLNLTSDPPKDGFSVANLCLSRRNGRRRIAWSQHPAPDITELRAAAKEHGFVEFSPQDFQNVHRALFAGDA